MKMMIMILTWDYYTKNDTLHLHTFFLNKNSLNIQQTLYYYTMNTNFTKTFHIHQINSKHNQHKTHKPSKIETQTTHCIQTRPQITRTNRKDTTAQTHTHTHTPNASAAPRPEKRRNLPFTCTNPGHGGGPTSKGHPRPRAPSASEFNRPVVRPGFHFWLMGNSLMEGCGRTEAAKAQKWPRKDVSGFQRAQRTKGSWIRSGALNEPHHRWYVDASQYSFGCIIFVLVLGALEFYFWYRTFHGDLWKCVRRDVERSPFNKRWKNFILL